VFRKSDLVFSPFCQIGFFPYKNGGTWESEDRRVAGADAPRICLHGTRLACTAKLREPASPRARF
jgi:hypothetical protein